MKGIEFPLDSYDDPSLTTLLRQGRDRLRLVAWEAVMRDNHFEKKNEFLIHGHLQIHR